MRILRQDPATGSPPTQFEAVRYAHGLELTALPSFEGQAGRSGVTGGTAGVGPGVLVASSAPR
jgi:hypothetical protein